MYYNVVRARELHLAIRTLRDLAMSDAYYKFNLFQACNEYDYIMRKLKPDSESIDRFIHTPKITYGEYYNMQYLTTNSAKAVS